MAAIMAEACRILGVSEIQLACEWDLETVDLSFEKETLVASDGGKTYLYLARGDDHTYVPWDPDLAQSMADDCDAELIDTGDDFSTGFVVRRRLRTGESPADAVSTMGRTIDRIFGSHLRPDLQ